MFSQQAKEKQKSNGFGNLMSLESNTNLPRFNRHKNRQGYGISNSIDFISHSPISNFRVTSDGGTFLMKEPSR